ncbi:diguanylate cyclase [Parapusillimonas sp. JC17]|uniref:diguanylate cyclase n=1 Tax=Parapusillimonas sp. JC17 TaxID=3445768 RepID=UPI003FA0A167
MAVWALPAHSAAACDGAQNIRLLKPVEFTAQQRAEFRAMPPLRVSAVGAPPMARYDDDSQTYSGIAIDVFCFIAQELGLSFEITPGRDQTVADKIRQVQEGLADVFIPLSHSAEREKRGLFTLPYYESHYAVIARHGSRVSVHSVADLANYKVGVVQGVSLQPLLQKVVPAAQLITYNDTTSDVIFQAVRDGEIDVAVFNKVIFIEKRYRQEFFDLDVVHTLHEYPRAYRYYFSRSPAHESLVKAFDRYLAVIDVSASVMIHEEGERHFFERYMAQRDQRVLLQSASAAAALLALVFCLALLRYRRLTRLLAERNAHIQQQQQALQEAYKKLQTLSRTDGLTWLSNRRHFDQMLPHEYGRYRRTGSPLSLLVIDVDHFKNVNDQYGHAVGDDYLRAIAGVLESSVARSTDLVARYGGEEFTCLLPDTAPEDAWAVAERIAHGVADLNLPNASVIPPHLTLSIGVATILEGDPGAQELFAQADAQLYTAKQLGRNRVRATIIGRAVLQKRAG